MRFANACLLMLLISSSLSQAADPPGRRLAVIVGVNAYRANAGLPSLNHAVADSERLSRVLNRSGYKVVEMTHDVARQAGKEVYAPNVEYIRDQIGGVLESPNLGSDDSVLISLHGHGVQFDEIRTVTRNGKQFTEKTPRFYFCPADATVAGIKVANEVTDRNHLLPLDELYGLLSNCKAATKLLIVDACRNDPSRPDSALREGELASLTLPKLPPPPGGMAAFFSCKANQRAVEDKDLGHGVFTHFLVQWLEGKADQPLEGKAADGIITLAELTTYVANNTYAYVFDKYQGRKQSPDIKGEFDTNLPLVRLERRSLPRTYRSKSTGLEMVLIDAGQFQMGSPVGEESRDTDEAQHLVRITKPFYVGKYEVTQGEFQRVMGFNPSQFTSDKDSAKFPVEQVSWFDAVEFCNRLSALDGSAPYFRLTNVQKDGNSIKSADVAVVGGNGYRLLTEAEWEYACRAETTTPFHFGAVLNGNQANVDGTSPYGTTTEGPYLKTTTTVGKYPANRWGLHDMHGNVIEWCLDWYGEDPASPGQVDPVNLTSGASRVLRGGSWSFNPRFARAADRYGDAPDARLYDLGFRVSRTP